MTKPLLKNPAERWLPSDLIHRRKVGLNLPMEDWLVDDSGLGRYLDGLTSAQCHLAAFTEHKTLCAVVEPFRNGQRHGLPSLPHLVNMELWLRSLVEPLGPAPKSTNHGPPPD